MSNETATLVKLSAAEQAAAIKKGDVTSRELVEAHLKVIEAAEPSIKAFLKVSGDVALEQADAFDAKSAEDKAALPELAGVPIAIKDMIVTKGIETTAASKILEGWVPPYDATVIEKLKAAGMPILGKTNLDEFAQGSSTEHSAYQTTHNPWDTERVPGGSGGGSASAVAAFEAPIALGTDTGGSIRQPGALTGTVGVKPTYGTVSRYGVVAFGSSLDQVGPFARSVEDAAAAMDALCGHDPLDCTSQDVKAGFRAACQQDVAGMRIGVVRSFMDAKGLSSEVSERVSEAAAKLEAAGATIVEVDLPHIDAAISAYYVLGPCEAFSNLARFDSVRYGYCEEGHKDLGSQYEASRAHGFGEEAKRRIMLGSYLLSAGVYEQYYYPAQQVRTLITQDYRNAYEQCDVILAPTAPATAFKFGEIADPATMYLSDVFTISINIAGNGGMSVPCGLGAQSGMPVGVQLIAPQFKDENMFRAAMALEAAYGKAPVAPNFADGKVVE